MDNQSPQPPSQQQELPQLNLTLPQQQIIAAHFANAVAELAQIRFSEKNHFDATLEHSFQQGRKVAFEELLKYDGQRFNNMQEQMNEQGVQDGN